MQLAAKWPSLRLPIELLRIYSIDDPDDLAFLYAFGRYTRTDFLISIESKTGVKYDYGDVQHGSLIHRDIESLLYADQFELGSIITFVEL